MLGSVTRKQSSKGALAQAHPNVVRIEKLPRHIEQLPVADALRWILEATHLTVYQALTRPRLARERLLTARAFLASAGDRNSNSRFLPGS